MSRNSHKTNRLREVDLLVGESVKDHDFQLRLDQVLRKYTSVAHLARAVSVSDNAIYKWMSGRGQPSVANLVSLAKAARVSVEWLATGRKICSIERVNEQSDYVYVPRYAVKATAPRGESLRSEQIVDYLAFKTDWVKSRLKTEPRNLLLIEAAGDSMVPTLRDGDLLLVDSGEQRFWYDGVYVLRREHELAVKRVQRHPDGTLTLRSDNAFYESWVVASETIDFIGRVIWTFGKL